MVSLRAKEREETRERIAFARKKEYQSTSSLRKEPEIPHKSSFVETQ